MSDSNDAELQDGLFSSLSLLALSPRSLSPSLFPLFLSLLSLSLSLLTLFSFLFDPSLPRFRNRLNRGEKEKKTLFPLIFLSPVFGDG
jgi:hypothetical protein